ncbi:MAG: hypothetical protein LUF00_09970 [Lachnospiraceae bacterium]|nr:hypothetical protein [Lachnospiraceae bacterium]
MMKDVLKRVLRCSLLCGIMVLGILAFRTEAVQAATTKYVAANTVSYTTVGSAKIKIKYISSNKYRIYFKKNDETYKKTVSGQVSAVTNGSIVYFKKVYSSALYKWNPVKGTTSKVGTVKTGDYGSSLSGGVNKMLYFSYSTPESEYTAAAVDLYRYSLSTKKSSKVKSGAYFEGSYGSRIVVENSTGSVQPVALYLYNNSGKKIKTITSKEFGATVSGKYVYYAKVTGTNIYSSSPYTVKFMKCNISTGNTKTICSTSVAVLSVYKVTSKYAIFWKDGSSCYKYTYSTGKLTEYTI